VTGYEMHMGLTTGPGLEHPWLELETATGLQAEGAISPDRRVMGCYVHGIFGSDAFRADWLAQVGVRAAGIDFAQRTEAALDALASHCEDNLDLDGLLRLAR
jgi:adenosylcobyric acid synthase